MENKKALVEELLMVSDLEDNARELTPDTTRLQNMFMDNTDNETIVLEGEFHLNRHIRLPHANNVTIDARNAKFYGQAGFIQAKYKGLHWIGGEFIGDGTQRLGFTIMHADNSVFEDMYFLRAVKFSTYVFDLMGCDNVTIKNCKFSGYGHTLSMSGLTEHNMIAEAIQLDCAREGASGADVYDQRFTGTDAKSYGDVFDLRPSKNITITGNTFKGYSENDELVAWGQCPVGQHAYVINDLIENITFTKNEIINTIPLNSVPRNVWRGALHFPSVNDLLIRDNVFKITKAQAKRKCWIYLVNNPNGETASAAGNRPSTKIRITRNNFSGAEPTEAYTVFESTGSHDNYAIKDIQVSNNAYINSEAEEPTNMVKVSGAKVQEPKAYGNHGLVKREIISYKAVIGVNGRVDTIYTSAPYGTPGCKEYGSTDDAEFKNKEIQVTEEQTNLEGTHVKATMDEEAYFFIDKRSIRKIG